MFLELGIGGGGVRLDKRTGRLLRSEYRPSEDRTHTIQNQCNLYTVRCRARRPFGPTLHKKVNLHETWCIACVSTFGEHPWLQNQP